MSPLSFPILRALPALCAGSAALLLAALVAAPAPAQPPAPDAQEEVIVVGRRLEESIPLDLEQFGNRVEIITADQLELGGFDDIGQTLQMQVPGLYLAPKNGAFDYMDCSLHGSRCQDILWLIDGVRINNRLYNTTAPLDTVPAHLVERIEVLYGGQGIFYGTQSVAGVVNVVTKPFREEPAGNVGVGFDGNGGIHASADFSIRVGDHRLVLYASKDEADGFRPFRA
ncbi:MAG TPA: TonB-dependent receptor plug domain-containing protein, partial [Gammaproteobacteria bacterium]